MLDPSMDVDGPYGAVLSFDGVDGNQTVNKKVGMNGRVVQENIDPAVVAVVRAVSAVETERNKKGKNKTASWNAYKEAMIKKGRKLMAFKRWEASYEKKVVEKAWKTYLVAQVSGSFGLFLLWW